MLIWNYVDHVARSGDEAWTSILLYWEPYLRTKARGQPPSGNGSSRLHVCMCLSAAGSKNFKITVLGVCWSAWSTSKLRLPGVLPAYRDRCSFGEDLKWSLMNLKSSFSEKRRSRQLENLSWRQKSKGNFELWRPRRCLQCLHVQDGQFEANGGGEMNPARGKDEEGYERSLCLEMNGGRRRFSRSMKRNV